MYQPRQKYPDQKQPFTVLVEGNIGSGKTAFLEHYAKHDDVFVLPQPVDQWRDFAGVDALDGLVRKPHEWAMPLETYASLSMLESHTKTTTKSLKMMESSLLTIQQCFVPYFKKRGVIPRGIDNMFNRLFDFAEFNVDMRIDMIVYLQTSPKTVYDRIKARARPEDSWITLEYLEEMNNLYNAWLTSQPSVVPVIILDADKVGDDFRSQYRAFEEALNLISAGRVPIKTQTNMCKKCMCKQ